MKVGDAVWWQDFSEDEDNGKYRPAEIMEVDSAGDMLLAMLDTDDEEWVSSEFITHRRKK